MTLSTCGTIHQKWKSTLLRKKILTARILGQYFKVRTVHIFCSLCMEFGLVTLSSDTDKVLKKIWRSRTRLLMNKILISENALTKWYLLGSIEFLATIKCLIIICCFLPSEFWQKKQKCPNLQDMSKFTVYAPTPTFMRALSIRLRNWCVCWAYPEHTSQEPIHALSIHVRNWCMHWACGSGTDACTERTYEIWKGSFKTCRA
jgi:hypothetical protein